MVDKYKYHFRPGYGSDKLLIEFFNGVDNKKFLTDFFDSIKEINPTIIDKQDIWTNDEVLLKLNSDVGQFTLSIDNWAFAFINSDDNQYVLTLINNFLIQDDRFDKVEVDFTDYKDASR